MKRKHPSSHQYHGFKLDLSEELGLLVNLALFVPHKLQLVLYGDKPPKGCLVRLMLY